MVSSLHWVFTNGALSVVKSDSDLKIVVIASFEGGDRYSRGAGDVQATTFSFVFASAPEFGS